MLDFIMSLFGFENVRNIKIPKEFKDPRTDKMASKVKFYQATGVFLDRVIVNDENMLLDGYTTLKLCNWLERRYVKVIRINVSLDTYLNEFKTYRLQFKTTSENLKKGVAKTNDL